MRIQAKRTAATSTTARLTAAVVLASALVACGNPSGPGGDRSLGILQFEGVPPIARTDGVGDDPIRWSDPPGETDTFPPEVLSAPDTVVVGEPFVVTAYTVGPNGCWSADGIDVEVEDRVMELTPWDRNSGADVCTMIFGFLAHPTTLTLDQLGEWTLRVVGRRVRGDGSLDRSVSAERTVFGRGPYSSEQPFQVTIPRGGEVQVDAVFGLAFAEVSADSRCPSDVVCVWAGDAEVVVGLRMGMGPTQAFPLHTSLDPRFVDYTGYRVTLVGLAPHPVSTSPIPQGGYRATFRVEKL